jgi:hypothetical protein
MVTDLGDAGVGTDLQGDLRYCITQANANQEAANQIVFDPSLAGIITLTQGVLSITKDVEINGPGASLLTVSGNHQSGVFTISADPSAQNVRISDLTIADGVGVPIPSGQGGGGLYNAHATVTLTGVTVTGNSVKGPGLQEGGGIYNDSGNLILVSSAVTDNSVGSGGHGGGIYDNLGGLKLDSSTVANNHAGVGGGGGGIATAGGFRAQPVTLTNCTIAGNSVSGFLGTGGGIENISHQLTISGGTISGNSSEEIAGGIFNVAATASLTDTHISGNLATGGGAGLDNDNGPGHLDGLLHFRKRE